MLIPDIRVQTVIVSLELRERNSISTRRVPLRWLLTHMEYEHLEAKIHSGLEDLMQALERLDGYGRIEDG